ncbi:MAG TPA: hypothetical protein VF956_01210 [Candidatus Dormibacteraeota bacterium]
MLAHNRSGNYRFLAAEGKPFSGGAVADDGYDLVHAAFERPRPLEAGLAAASRHVVAAGRPVHAIAGFELRIPRPLTQAAFTAFNERYVASLKRLGLEVDGLMPAARTNVADVVGSVSEPSLFAVSYTMVGHRTHRAFVLSGVPEEEGADTAARLDSIMRVLSGRLDALGVNWEDATAIQMYGVDDFQDLVVERVLKATGAAAVHGIRWFPSLPPIEDLRLEIDVRSAGTELVIGA